MPDTNQPKKYNVEELRKTYPRMGMRWDAEEDEKLKKRYEEFRSGGSADFDAFIIQLVKDFGRAAGGLKARLAMHFEDVPGWDYERTRNREQETNKQVESKFSSEQDEKLLREYKAYVQNKRETYIHFLKRLHESSGIEGKFLTARLQQLVGTIEKYNREDIRPIFEKKTQKQEDVPIIDFSGNPESLEALRIMNDTRENLFLTGEAGTGKSTLLQYFRRTTEKNVVVLAPTGVAALNVEGQTVHSFCGFGPDITPTKVKKLSTWAPKRKLLANLQTIIIDEISMVRADLLDCVDKFLRINLGSTRPFAGIQMIFIGDLFQLPPVDKDFVTQYQYRKQHASDPDTDSLFNSFDPDAPSPESKGLYESPYFFDSHVFKESLFTYLQLRKIYRQQDQAFIDVLNAVRNNVATQNHLIMLNQRTEDRGAKFTFEQFAIYLTPTNVRARQINNFFLEKIPGELKRYKGSAAGTFENRELPTDLDLQIKIGSQIMMLNNDRRKRWVNGTMGKVVGVEKAESQGESFVSQSSSEYTRPANIDAPDVETEYILDKRLPLGSGSKDEPITYEYIPDEPVYQNAPNTDAIVVELESGETVYVEPYTWEMYKFVYDKDTQGIDSQATGTYTQYPFKLAWAVTIHKAQGKTFNKVYIDLATGTFAHGQLYVALSRCRTLEGLYLKRAISQQDIILDKRVVHFLKNINNIRE